VEGQPLDPAASDDWLSKLNDLGWGDRTVSHASYLINLASPDDELWNKSIDLMTVELERCEASRSPSSSTTPARTRPATATAGLTRIAKAYKRSDQATKGFGP
jgi:deoxyribonuclease-4